MALGVFPLVLLLAGVLAWLIVARIGDQYESAVPLGVFRIAYGAVLFCEVMQIWLFERRIGDPFAFVPPQLRSPFLVGWLIAISFLTLGLFTRPAAIVNYVAGLCTISVFRSFEYHVDYVITGMNLLLVVAPVGRCLSLDRMRETRRAGTEPAPAARVSKIYRRVFVLVGIAFVYFDSIFWKFNSPMWMNGLGVWMPASLPQVIWYDYSLLLDQEWLMKALGYTTLVLETLFIVLMWFDKLAWPLALIGLGLHLGIAMVFPIPWFGLAVSAIYTLVLPPQLYEWLGQRLTRRDRAALEAKPIAGVPMTPPTRVAVVFLLTVLLACQVAATAQSPMFNRLMTRVADVVTAQRLAILGGTVTHSFAQPALGITPHPVFMDSHFVGYNHIATIVYVEPGKPEEWLPILRPNGLVHWLSSGRFWVFWTWRAMGPTVNVNALVAGVEDETAFWMQRNGVSPLDATFRLMVKRIDVPTHWEAGFLHRQQAKPWIDAGVATWKNGVFHASIKNVEAL